MGTATREHGGPLHIVQVPRRFVLDEWGGTETVILETGKRLLARGHHCEVLCPAALATEGPDAVDGLKVTRTSYFYPYLNLSPEARRRLDKKGGNLFSFSLMRDLRRRPRLDLIHLHTGNRLGGIVRTVAKGRNIPYVVSLHGGIHDVPPQELEDLLAPTRGAFDWGKPLGWWVGARRTLEDAACILCVGKPEQEKTQARFPHKRVVYLPNGVTLDRFAQGNGTAFRKANGIPLDARVLLTVSRIDPQKNQALLVKVLPELRRHDPTLHVVLLGPATNESYRAQLEKSAAEAGVAGALHILPGLRPNDPALADAYHAGDVFVLPSVHEPFGIVILEAWAAGLPVLASRIGGIPHFVEDGVDGLLFDPTGPSDFVRAYRALSPDLARAATEAGQAKIRREYTWDAITDRLLKIYEEALDGY